MRRFALGRTYAPAALILALASLALAAASASAVTGGASAPPPPETTPNLTTPLPKAQLSPDGKVAVAPASAPLEVQKAIWAANRITNKPYRYGGGHRRFRDSGYDCSGAVSYALRGGKLVRRPLHSSAFMRWGESGRGDWITVYTNPGHAYVVIAGLRFDTSGPGERGPRWRKGARSSRSYSARHPEGF